MQEILGNVQHNAFLKIYDPSESQSVILTRNVFFLEKPDPSAISSNNYYQYFTRNVCCVLCMTRMN